MMDKCGPVDDVKRFIRKRKMRGIRCVKLNAPMFGITSMIFYDHGTVFHNSLHRFVLGAASQHTLQAKVGKYYVGATHWEVELFARTPRTDEKNCLPREVPHASYK